MCACMGMLKIFCVIGCACVRVSGGVLECRAEYRRGGSAAVRCRVTSVSFFFLEPGGDPVKWQGFGDEREGSEGILEDFSVRDCRWWTFASCACCRPLPECD